MPSNKDNERDELNESVCHSQKSHCTLERTKVCICPWDKHMDVIVLLLPVSVQSSLIPEPFTTRKSYSLQQPHPPDPCCVVTVLRIHCASQHPTPRSKYLPVPNCSCPCCFHTCCPHAYFSSKHHVHMSHSCIMSTWLIYTWYLHVSFMYLIHTPCLYISFTYFVYMPCPYSHPYTVSTYLIHV